MHVSPYVSGAITAAIFLSCNYLLPKKLGGTKRTVISILLTVVIALIIRFFIDWIAE